MKTTPHHPSGQAGAAVVQYSKLDAPFGYVYAIGRVQATFPSKDVEKEFQQLLTPDDMSAPTEEQRLYNVLSRPSNVYFAREMAWVFSVQNVATYLLEPRSAVELQALIDAIKPDDPTQAEYDVIIGAQEPLAVRDDSMPVVLLNRLYHFTAKAFVESIPPPPSISQLPNGPAKDQTVASFRALVLDIFEDMLQLADNTGDADEHRALNYVSLNYPDIYTLKWSSGSAATGDVMAFKGVDVRHSPLGGGRRIMDIVFSYVNASGVVSRFYTSVDVTGQFPFLVTKLQPYFER